jgi:hypothetical protein
MHAYGRAPIVLNVPKLRGRDEMTGRQVHRTSTVVLSLAMVAIGIALLVEAIGGEGALSARLLLGVLFIAAGTGRLYIQVRKDRGT